MHNLEIRSKIRQSGFYNYEIAAAMGIPETSFSRMMAREELSEEKKKTILETINKLIMGRKCN